ncbi:DM13 domain-containing protein [Gloeothece verrucosa]|uniref:Electron transfer DM13 n=1 Tax=Gloeothece verrucosa (strain PCC 7822) TaxID=497965 RepID=E0UIF2_GLOV7|nr:DM13 domain-containing protein [Gloeothece verrucosa]ADN16920.1 Electron transfer DM13 [Gloeothece verrucosa PCC 7822]
MKFSRFILWGMVPVMGSVIATASYGRSLSDAKFKTNLVPATAITQRQTQTIAFTGNFVKAEAPTTGTARIVREGGHNFLELDGAFSTSNQGPDLHVLLDSSTTPPQSYSNQNSYINLGKLRSFQGAQRYPIPDGIDLTKYKSVVIWCRMANATFGYASLRPNTNARK